MKRRIILLLLSVVLVLSLTAGFAADSAESDGNIRIGVSMSSLGNPFYGLMETTFMDYGKENGCDVTVVSAEGDLQKQVRDIEDLVTQGIDVLIVNPFEANALVDAVTAVREKGIPVVTVDNDVSAETPVNAAVLTDNFGNGVEAGRLLVQTIGNEPIKAFLLSGDPGSYVGQLRRDGLFQGIIEEQLALYGKTQFEVVYQVYVPGWSHQDGVMLLEQNVAAHDFNVFLAESDEWFYLARDILEAAGVLDTWMACSADGSKNVLGAVIDGSLPNIISALNNPISLAEGAIDVSVKLANGEDVARDQLAPVNLFYDKATAEQFYDTAW